MKPSGYSHTSALQPGTATTLNAEQRNKQMCRNKCGTVIVPLPKVLEKYQLAFRWGVFIHLWGGGVCKQEPYEQFCLCIFCPSTTSIPDTEALSV